MDGITRVPPPRNEPVLDYAPGSPERAALETRLAELAAEPLDDLCDAVIERLQPEGLQDDVALVAIRLHRQDRPRPAEAGPQRVPPAVGRE